MTEPVDLENLDIAQKTTLGECYKKLDAARAERSIGKIFGPSLLCYLGLHRFKPGPTFEEDTGTKLVLWNLQICERCFEDQRIDLGECRK